MKYFSTDCDCRLENSQLWWKHTCSWMASLSWETKAPLLASAFSSWLTHCSSIFSCSCISSINNDPCWLPDWKRKRWKIRCTGQQSPNKSSLHLHFARISHKLLLPFLRTLLKGYHETYICLEKTSTHSLPICHTRSYPLHHLSFSTANSHSHFPHEIWIKLSWPKNVNSVA